MEAESALQQALDHFVTAEEFLAVLSGVGGQPEPGIVVFVELRAGKGVFFLARCPEYELTPVGAFEIRKPRGLIKTDLRGRMESIANVLVELCDRDEQKEANEQFCDGGDLFDF